MARLSTEVYWMSGWIPDSAISCPARLASARPWSLRSTSTQPVKRFLVFQSELPWRNRISVWVMPPAYRGVRHGILGAGQWGMARPTAPQGRITRGTTGVNRLRRVDRWIAALPVLRATADPLVVDLGYGVSA